MIDDCEVTEVWDSSGADCATRTVVRIKTCGDVNGRYGRCARWACLLLGPNYPFIVSELMGRGVSGENGGTGEPWTYYIEVVILGLAVRYGLYVGDHDVARVEGFDVVAVGGGGL